MLTTLQMLTTTLHIPIFSTLIYFERIGHGNVRMTMVPGCLVRTNRRHVQAVDCQRAYYVAGRAYVTRKGKGPGAMKCDNEHLTNCL